MLERSIGRSQIATDGGTEIWTLQEKLKDFTLYPNPNDGTFVIEGIETGKVKQIEIYDVQGKKIDFELLQINETTVQVEFREVQRGLYLVSIWNENGEKQTVRLVKN